MTSTISFSKAGFNVFSMLVIKTFPSQDALIQTCSIPAIPYHMLLGEIEYYLKPMTVSHQESLKIL